MSHPISPQPEGHIIREEMEVHEGVDIRDRGPSPEQPLSELISNLTEDTSRLFRQEVALARAEVKQEATVAGKGVGMLAGAGIGALVASILLSFALAEAIKGLFDIGLGWGYLIVGVLWLIVAGVLASMGRKKLAEMNPKPERTVETLREIPETLKGNG